MISQTAMDVWQAEHAAMTARTNRDDWMFQTPMPIESGPRRSTVGSMRRRIGSALVHAGVRLQGAPVAHPADPVTA